MLICLILLVIIKNGFSANNVFIYQSSDFSQEYFIVCTISGTDADKFTPYLHCPLTKSRMCYSNCTDDCTYPNEQCKSLLAIYNCKYKHLSSDHIEIQYYISHERIQNIKGEWYCSYAGVNSKAITLTIPRKKIVTTKRSVITNARAPQILVKDRPKNFEPEVVRVEKITDVIDVVTLPVATSKAREINQNLDSNEDLSFKAFITKFQVVVGILCLFAISVILNITFCIRDSLIKYYIENIKNNLPSSKFLLFCICQRETAATLATAKLDRVLSKDTDYSKLDPLNSRNNLYDFDSQGLLLPHLQNPYNEIIPSPHIVRSRSIQYTSPTAHPGFYDPYYMSVPRGLSSRYHGIQTPAQYVPVGTISLADSDTTHEDVISEGPYQLDTKGNIISKKLGPTNASINAQNIDLINDCGQNQMSESASNVSKKE